MEYINELIQRNPSIIPCKKDIMAIIDKIIRCYTTGGKLLIAGNGGSAADADHIVGELLKGFAKKRCLLEETADRLEAIDSIRGGMLKNKLQRGLPAISLISQGAILSAVINDIGADFMFSQQIIGYGMENDVFWGISTSGNSENIVNAAITAKAIGLVTIALIGGDGGALAKVSDISIIVPEILTYKIQELHLPIYHAICLEVEEYFFKE